VREVVYCDGADNIACGGAQARCGEVCGGWSHGVRDAQDRFDNGRVFDTGNPLHGTVVLTAGLAINLEHTRVPD